MHWIHDPAAPMPVIACEVCQHEIPLSEAVVPEASDYVAYFCSLDCYAAWRARAAALRMAS
jgi:hypothetical protein